MNSDILYGNIFINNDDGLDFVEESFKFSNCPTPEYNVHSPCREHPSTSILVNNVPPNIFDTKETRKQFEEIVKNIEPSIEIKFLHIKALNRIRIILSTAEFSNKIFNYLHGMQMLDQKLHCSFFTPLNYDAPKYLSLPPPTKLFLISPPASPPVGWERVMEKEPVINHELIDAINRLGKQEYYELTPATDMTPSIRVQLCSDSKIEDILHPRMQGAIPRTRCPSGGVENPFTGELIKIPPQANISANHDIHKRSFSR